ncbi:response regulator [Novosphingobium sp. G106]|uniref:ATP-binding protein n=1 Tax=Novosphingobium sp. G106 TaxID=2849500 RepID=UPI001C2D7A79|nr:ATP-binding protein [Novosphingobium sp. G106]MBV1690351.1 response regulator [Novosphingobium sp. G106]
MLNETGVVTTICRDIQSLVEELDNGAGFAVVTEEALMGKDLRLLKLWIESQPEWSDFPFVLLTQRGGGLERNPAAARHLETLGNVTFLERPFHPTTLISLAQAALRGRRRQYEARARLESLRESEASLEQRVQMRTEELQQAQEALRQSQKMEAIGTLTGGVAHDFNNLLTPILGTLDLLQRRITGPREIRLIEGALQSAERAKTLVQRLLAFARRQPLQARSVDLGDLIRNMMDLVASTSGPRVAITLAIPGDLPPVHTDPHQLEMAILNLAVNARDAMPEGGTLTIAASEQSISHGERADLEAGQYIHLQVADTGTGMDEATLERAIEPFFSTKGIGQGTGLGLSMVHGLAAQLGGSMRISSEVGAGTSVDLWLPLSSDPLAANQPAEESAANADDRSGRVLLVDDEPLIRMSTADMLSEMGYSVTEAASGEEALEILADGLDPDILITDHLMPGITGTELAQRVREKSPATTVLIISGYAEVEGIAPDLARLTKPFRETDLATMLEGLTSA